MRQQEPRDATICGHVSCFAHEDHGRAWTAGPHADDDPLVFNVSSDAVGSKKIDPVEPVGFQIGPHPIESRSIQQRAGVAVVNVLLGKHVTRDSDLSFQLDKLAFNCSFLLLRVGAPAGVQCGLRHTW
jgi:hypothetical protein